jgi:nuclear pore complex protein Nup188
MMVKVVIGCLNANLKDDSPEAIFANLMKTRAEFAVDILQGLTGVPKTIQQQQKHQIIATTVEAIRVAGGSFAGALLNGTVDYYRLLLRVLFLVLQLLASEGPDRPAAVDLTASGRERQPPKKPIDILGLVLEILTTTVAQGFRGLTSALHEDPTKGNPADFAIVDAILRSCLQVEDVHFIYPSIITHFGDGAARSAITLFSYADKLTVNGDPIYGDLSIRFLLQLSTIPALAEMLATEGLLNNLSTSTLTHYFRRPKGSGAFDNPSRMFTMWANGILPICINLLDSVGRSMASEISSFLNQFQSQLDRATSAFTNRYVAPSRSVQKPAASSITLSMASEAGSLALIAYILETYRNAGPSAGVDATEIAELKWDAKQVKEDIEELLGNRAGLRERIVATDDKEMSMWKVRVGEGEVTRLEERIVKELKGAVMCLDGGLE